MKKKRPMSCFLLPMSTILVYALSTTLISQEHNLQKLNKMYLLQQLILFATKSKLTCLSENIFFHSHILDLPQYLWSCG